MTELLAAFFSWNGQQVGVLVYLLAVLGNTVLNWLLLPRLGSHPQPETWPGVAVLVPARNEERNIRRCLEALLGQDYPAVSVWVLDDDSTDRTPAILAELAAAEPRLHVLSSEALPQGWLGKNWACWQLAQAVPESVPLLLFVDADTWHAPHMLRVTVAALIAEQYDLLSVLPRQVTKTLVERLTVPVLPWALLSHFAMWWPRQRAWPALSAAVGQCMLWRRDAYQKVGGHAAVRTRVAEDMALARRVAAQGLRGGVLPGPEYICCRMYRSTVEVLEGFGKNLFAVFGRRGLPYLFIWLWLGTVFCSPPVMLIGWWLADWPVSPLLAALSIAVAALIWAAVVRMSGLGLEIVPLYPFVTLATLLLAFHSLGQTLSRRARWKGRPVGWSA